MSTKVKGLLKGIKYISHQIFEEEKEPEIQIGMPTDVKHVAHIGWDGPSATENPSWMNEFKGSGALKSAPLGPPTDSKENPEIKWVSEDSKGRRAPRPESRDGGAGGEGSSKPRRHSCSNDNTAGAAGGGGGGGDSPKSSKPRQTRRSKASSDGVKIKDPAAADNPDVPKRNRRKKSRDFNADGSVRSTRTSKSSATAADQAQDTTNADPPPSSTSSKPLDDGENPVLF